MTTKKTAAWYAKQYAGRFGFHIVPIEPGRKFPRSRDWGNTALTDPDAAVDYYTKNPDWNMGVALGPSGLCSLDIDCFESFSLICEAFGFDLAELIKNTPTIQGRAPGLRLMFRVPDGVDLPYIKLNWPNEKDPSGDIHRSMMAKAKDHKDAGETDLETAVREEAKQYSRYTVFELRAATDGSQKQDVLPPSIHSGTGKPYVWITQPVARDWPTPPVWLLTAWQEFTKIKPQFMAACPWSIAPEIKPTTVRDTKPRYSGGGDNIVAKYNDAHNIDAALAANGYERRGDRWLSPHSSTQLPGVVALPDSNKVYIHHASDPLCSVDSGQPVGPFDLFCYYNHGGDFKRAAIAASELLGIRYNAPVHNAPAYSIDQDTGEVVYDEPAVNGAASNGIVVNGHDLGDTTAALPDASAHHTDHASPLPWSNSKGKPLKHHENLAEICRRMGVTVRYNVIKKAEEILIPGKSFSMDNAANASLAWLVSQCSVFEFSTDRVGEFVTLLAEDNLYNPVANWITSKPWDGKSRLACLYDTVTVTGGVERQALRDTLIKRWMLSACAAAFNPNGVSAHGVLVFQGGQSIGKTSWFKALVPESLEVLADGLLLRPEDKDSVKLCVSNWLVELGELDATFRKSDIAALKSFLTRNKDEIRLPYARRESQFARRTVFFGSVNPKEYLHDDTGNRRYWTVECQDINYKHGLDMQQIWAEVYDLYRAGEQHWLTTEENDALNEVNEEYMTIDPVREVLMHNLAWHEPKSTWRWIQATQALIECGMDRPNKGDSRSASAVIRAENGDMSRRVRGQRLLLCPELIVGKT